MAIQAVDDARIIYCTGSSEDSAVARINSDHPFAILFNPSTHSCSEKRCCACSGARARTFEATVSWLGTRR